MTTTSNPYSIKNLKTFTGREGPGYNVDLYRDGKKIAFVYDDASGGPVDFQWVEGYGINAPEYARLDEYAKSLPPQTTDMVLGGKPFVYQPDMDFVVNNLVEALQVERELKRRLKGRIMIRLPQDKPGEFRVVGGKDLTPTDWALGCVAKQYPDAVILNRLPFDEALRVYRAGGAA